MTLPNKLLFTYVFGYFFISIFANIYGSEVSLIYKFLFLSIVVDGILKSNLKFNKANNYLLLISIFYGFRLVYDLIYLNNESLYGNYRYFIDLFLWGIIPLIYFSKLKIKLESFQIKNNLVYLTNLIYLIVFVYAVFIANRDYGDRVGYLALNPISFGTFSALTFYLNLSTFLKIKKKHLIFLFIVPLVGLILSQSRGNFLSIIFILIASIFNVSRLSILKKIFYMILIYLFLFGVIFFLKFDIISFTENIGSENDLSAISRIDNYNIFYEKIKSNWFFGYGVLTENNGYMHNVYLELFSSVGFISFPFIMFILYMFLRIGSNHFYAMFSKHAIIIGFFSGIYPSIIIPIFVLINFYYSEKNYIYSTQP